MRVDLVLVLLFKVALESECFSSGIPPTPTVCRSMIPQHHDYFPQIDSSPPYELTTDVTMVAQNAHVRVSLKSLGDDNIRGFYIQGRNDDKRAIGSFIPNEDTKVHSCWGIRANGAHHSNGNLIKENIEVIWKAPKNYVGNVTFQATVVRDFVNTWAGMKAPTVEVTGDSSKNEVRESRNNTIHLRTITPSLAPLLNLGTSNSNPVPLFSFSNQCRKNGTRMNIVQRSFQLFNKFVTNIQNVFQNILRREDDRSVEPNETSGLDC